MIWQTWLEHAATALGVTTIQAGVLLSFIFTGCFIMAILIVTKGRKAFSSVSLTSFLLIVMFTYMGWMPLWTGSVIAILIAVFIAQKIAKDLS